MLVVSPLRMLYKPKLATINGGLNMNKSVNIRQMETLSRGISNSEGAEISLAIVENQ